MTALMTRDGPNDDETEDWLAWGVERIFFEPFNMVIGLRDVTGAVQSSIEGYGGRAPLGKSAQRFHRCGAEKFLREFSKGEDLDARKAFDAAWKATGAGTYPSRCVLGLDQRRDPGL